MMDAVPKTYRELADLVRNKIQAGSIQPGQILKAEKLASEYKISRQTAQRALTVIASEGLVRTIRGTGAVVQPPRPRRRIARGQLVTRNPHYGYVFPATSDPMEPWQAHGQPYRSHEPAPLAIAETFGLDAGTEVLRRRRVMSPEGEPPFQIADTWISPTAVADAPQVAEPSTGPGGYLDRLEEAGHGPIAWRETTRVRMPSEEEARLLEISTGLPVLEISMVGRSAQDDQPVEVTVKVIPSDRVELVTDLVRAESAAWPVDPVQSR
nr:GntR family transcriptional regulator [Streptomyces sp. FR1]